jgi:hypothetical protein
MLLYESIVQCASGVPKTEIFDNPTVPRTACNLLDYTLVGFSNASPPLPLLGPNTMMLCYIMYVSRPGSHRPRKSLTGA